MSRHKPPTEFQSSTLRKHVRIYLLVKALRERFQLDGSRRPMTAAVSAAADEEHMNERGVQKIMADPRVRDAAMAAPHLLLAAVAEAVDLLQLSLSVKRDLETTTNKAIKYLQLCQKYFTQAEFRALVELDEHHPYLVHELLQSRIANKRRLARLRKKITGQLIEPS